MSSKKILFALFIIIIIPFSGCISQDYTVVGNNVYWRGNIIEDADSKSFVVIKDSFFYAKDANRVYCLGKELAGLDPATFIIIGPTGLDVAKDKDSVVFKCEKEPLADAGTFSYIERWYYRDKSSVFITFDDEMHVINGADPDTFSALEEYYEYARDKNYVYLYYDTLDGANPDTFVILNFSYPVYYSKDDKFVFYGRYKIAGADPATFSSTDSGYSKDNTHVFYESNTIENGDVATFSLIYLKGECLGGLGCHFYVFGKDKNNVYVSGKTLPGVKPEEIEDFKQRLIDKDPEAIRIYYSTMSQDPIGQ